MKFGFAGVSEFQKHCRASKAENPFIIMLTQKSLQMQKKSYKRVRAKAWVVRN